MSDAGDNIRRAYSPRPKPTPEQETRAHFAYAGWRFLEWVKGGRSYTEIDEAVARGELVPQWPAREAS